MTLRKSKWIWDVGILISELLCDTAQGHTEALEVCGQRPLRLCFEYMTQHI
jgi:hypothetical protein